LKYIQCRHCEKKYAVSEKLRLAAGKKIRCKHCSQIFEIIIQGDDEPSGEIDAIISGSAVERTEDHGGERADDASRHVQTSQEEGAAEHSEAVRKQKKLQLSISILLGTIFVCAAIGAYLYFYQPEWLNRPENNSSPPIIPSQLVNPMQAGSSGRAGVAGAEKKPVPAPESGKKPLPVSAQLSRADAPTSGQTKPVAKKRLMMLDGPEHPSQVCKDVAAEYWLRTHVLGTTKLEFSAYMKLLNMNTDQAGEIRTLCKDKLLVGRITEAAKAEQQPAWISAELKSRLLTGDASQTASSTTKK